MNFRIGQIFEADYPMEAAVWCDKNSAYIKEIAPANGARCFQIVAVPTPTEAELAAQALAQAKAERAEAVAAITVTVDGMLFDGDEKAQERMARAVLMAESPEESIEWVLADNTVTMVTAEQLRRACRAAGKTMGVLWVKPYQTSTDSNTANTGYSVS